MSKVISAKLPDEDEIELLEKTRDLLYKQGKIPRNTTSTAIRYIINEACPRICHGTWEKRTEEIRTCKRSIAKLKQENRELSEQIDSLSYHNCQLQQANVRLLSDRNYVLIEFVKLLARYNDLQQKYQSRKEEWDTVKVVYLGDAVITAARDLDVNPYLFTTFFLDQYEKNAETPELTPSSPAAPSSEIHALTC